MTQYYKMPGFTLANANASTKVLVTLFLLSVIAGLAVALLQYADRAGGLGDRAAREWIQGNEDDLEATTIRAEKSYGELLAITHEHAFSLPILLFVVLHLVALVTIGERLKIALYVAGFVSLAATFAGPWLVYAYGAAWTPVIRWGGIALTAVLAIATMLCLWELWGTRPWRRWRRRPEPAAPDPMFPSRRGA